MREPLTSRQKYKGYKIIVQTNVFHGSINKNYVTFILKVSGDNHIAEGVDGLTIMSEAAIAVFIKYRGNFRLY